MLACLAFEASPAHIQGLVAGSGIVWLWDAVVAVQQKALTAHYRMPAAACLIFKLHQGMAGHTMKFCSTLAYALLVLW